MAKKTETEIFTWDWKDQPPLRDIIAFARAHPKLTAYDVDTGSDTIALVFAKDREAVRAFFKEEDMPFISFKKVQNPE